MSVKKYSNIKNNNWKIMEDKKITKINTKKVGNITLLKLIIIWSSTTTWKTFPSLVCVLWISGKNNQKPKVTLLLLNVLVVLIEISLKFPISI